MAMPRQQAFGCFEDLLAEGLRPCLTGFRAGDDDNPYWPKDSEGFFLSTRLKEDERSQFTIEALTRMREIGDKHDLEVWFSGMGGDTDEEGAPIYGVRVVFEPRKTVTGQQT
jgi:hypothetical protein